jgi:hypothetical protein
VLVADGRDDTEDDAHVDVVVFNPETETRRTSTGIGGDGGGDDGMRDEGEFVISEYDLQRTKALVASSMDALLGALTSLQLGDAAPELPSSEAVAFAAAPDDSPAPLGAKWRDVKS